MSYVEDKDKNKILEEMYSTALPGSRVHEQQKMAIIVRCTEDLEVAIKSLKNKVAWLNIILTAATVVGAIATAVIAYNSLFH